MSTKVKKADSVQALAESIGKPSLQGLAYALRHPETWPKGFVWDYPDCDRCAMGLAEKLWNLGIVKPTLRFRNAGERRRHYTSLMASTFALPYETADNVFFGGYGKKPIGMILGRVAMVPVENEDVTPEMVADRIDSYLRD